MKVKAKSDIIHYDEIQVNANLGVDTEFEGSLRFSSSALRIQGKFKGEIHTNGLLLIDKGALVEGKLYVGSILIWGLVRGNIEAKNKVELHTDAKLYGNIKTKKLKIADGVLFEGNCDMVPAKLSS